MNFSVLMSIYYKENPQYLKEALQSIVNQTLMPKQIVLVEDGKLTEELYTVINEFVYSYPNLCKIVKMEENSGLGNALRVGINYCDYEYVARMDSDDISVANRFEKQIKVLEKEKDVDVIGTNILEFEGALDNAIAIRKVPEYNKQIKKFLKFRNPINHVSVIFKKNAVIESGNYEECLYFEDYWLWCRMISKNKKFYNIQEPLVKVRSGDEMYVRRGGKKYCKAIINFETKKYRLGVINIWEYVFNILIKITISCFPNKLRGIIYKKGLRKKINYQMKKR